MYGKFLIDKRMIRIKYAYEVIQLINYPSNQPTEILFNHSFNQSVDRLIDLPVYEFIFIISYFTGRFELQI